MARLIERLFAVAPPRARIPSHAEEADAEHVPVRFRPRLIAQLLHEHGVLRASMRNLLDACRRRDEDAQILGLREVAATFRRLELVKATQLHPYLRWGLERDRMATIQLKAMQADVQRALREVEAVLDEYLGGPWLRAQRERFVAEVARVAHLLAVALKLEEATVFPLYLPPGQYRHVRDPLAD